MATSRGVVALLVTGLLVGANTISSGTARAVPGLDPSSPNSHASSSSASGAARPSAQAGPGVTVPDFATRAWVLADMDSGAILAQLNPHQRLRPASTQKLLTALTVAPQLSADQLYRADKADEVADGNRVVLYDGLTYKVSDLLHAALLPSANDAAMALAKANGGAARTVAQMNEEAARLGATDTTAVNPSGLDADGQFTSAHDLAVIGRAAFANPELAAILKMAVADFPGKQKPDGSRVIYPIYNHNTMLRSGFKGVLGGKSGYTTLARRTMVAAAQRGDRRLIVALMDIGGNTYRTAEQVLNWGFAHQDQLTAIGALPEPSAPAPTFERAIVPLADASAVPAGDVGKGEFAGAQADEQESSDAAPPAPAKPAGGNAGGGLSLLLTVLTLLAAAVAVARGRVFWLAHRAGRPVTRKPRARQTASRPAPSRPGQVRSASSRARTSREDRPLVDSRSR